MSNDPPEENVGLEPGALLKLENNGNKGDGEVLKIAFKVARNVVKVHSTWADERLFKRLTDIFPIDDTDSLADIFPIDDIDNVAKVVDLAKTVRVSDILKVLEIAKNKSVDSPTTPLGLAKVARVAYIAKLLGPDSEGRFFNIADPPAGQNLAYYVGGKNSVPVGDLAKFMGFQNIGRILSLAEKVTPGNFLRVVDVVLVVGSDNIVKIVNLAKALVGEPAVNLRGGLAIIAEIMDFVKVAAFVKNMDWCRICLTHGKTTLQTLYPALAIESLTSNLACLEYETPKVDKLIDNK